MNVASIIRFLVLIGMLCNPVLSFTEHGSQKNSPFTHYHDKKGFAKKVSEYIKNTKANVHLVEQNPTIQELLDEKKVKTEFPKGEIQPKEFKALQELVQDVSKALEQIHIDDVALAEQVRSALLLRAAVPFYFYTRCVVLDILKHIDKQITSWEHRASHPVSYFFHKSPLKWFSKKSQREEIREALSRLRNLQKKHFQILGELTAHVGRFDTQAPYDKQYEWLTDLLSLSLHMYHEEVNKQQLMATKVMMIMTEATRRLPKYYQGTLKTIQQLQVPGHFEKYWLSYALVGAGATATSIWLFKNYQRVPGMMQDAKQNIVNRMFVTPYNAIKDAFFGKERDQVQERPIREIVDEINKIWGKKEIDTQEVHRLFIEVMTECQKEGYLNDVQGFNEQTINQAAHDLINAAEGNAQNAIDLLEHAMHKSMDKFKALKSARGLRGYWDASTRGINETGLYVPLVHLYAQAYKLKGNALSKPSQELINALTGRGERLLDDSERLIKQNRVTAALTTIVPIALTIYGSALGIKKLLAKMHGRPEYRPIRHALIEISHILNSHKENDIQSAEMEGKFNYYIENLNQQLPQVPADQRRRFFQDVCRLESPTLSAEQKMNSIRLMYNTYDFLAPNYR